MYINKVFMYPSEEVAVSSKLAKMAVTHICLVISTLLFFAVWIEANSQADNLRSLLASKWSQNKPVLKKWLDVDHTLDEYVVPQTGSMKDDKIVSLPGQPDDVDFDQYAGYVTVDATVGKALFYYFVESPQSSSTNTNPLVLWLNGGNALQGNQTCKRIGILTKLLVIIYKYLWIYCRTWMLIPCLRRDARAWAIQS